MERIDQTTAELGVDGLRILEVLDDNRNPVLRVERTSQPGLPLAAKLLKPEFEPLLPGRRRAGSRKLLRAIERSPGWVPVQELGTTAHGLDYLLQPLYTGSLLDTLGDGRQWRTSITLLGEIAAIVGRIGAQKLPLGFLRPTYVLLDIADLRTGGNAVAVSVYGMSTRRFDDGTTQYHSPQQRQGHEPTTACDVYALGLILAELLADRQRHPDESIQDLMQSLPHSLPEPVIDLLDHTLADRQTNRIANASLLSRAIDRLLIELPNQPADEPPPGHGEPGDETTATVGIVAGDGGGKNPDRAATIGPSDPAPDEDTTLDAVLDADSWLREAEATSSLDNGDGQRPHAEPRPAAAPQPPVRYRHQIESPRSMAEAELEAMIETLGDRRPGDGSSPADRDRSGRPSTGAGTDDEDGVAPEQP